ncbi:MAG TPA: ABC transporter permease subunit [Anaerolineales bacterium]|nr:ABC transporter permease subunit [Anaerolineales bacterium]
MSTITSSPAEKPRFHFSLDWLGLAPFFLFALLFIVLASSNIIVRSILDEEGNFTFANIQGLTDANIVDAYTTSIQISLITALMGGVLGFLVAYAIVIGGVPRWARTVIITFSSLTSQFGGVTLAFAFVATIGRTGFITAIFKDVFDLQIYRMGFNLYSVLGLSLTYLYFQFPLMVLIMAPALEGLKTEWREASENLGANQWQYWRHVAFPVLLPSLLGTMLLLFANAFGAQATAYALTGGTINLVTIVLSAQIRGDVLRNPGLGYSLALGMIVIMGVCIGGYTLLQRQSERWLKR